MPYQVPRRRSYRKRRDCKLNAISRRQRIARLLMYISRLPCLELHPPFLTIFSAHGLRGWCVHRAATSRQRRRRRTDCPAACLDCSAAAAAVKALEQGDLQMASGSRLAVMLEDSSSSGASSCCLRGRLQGPGACTITECDAMWCAQDAVHRDSQIVTKHMCPKQIKPARCYAAAASAVTGRSAATMGAASAPAVDSNAFANTLQVRLSACRLASGGAAAAAARPVLLEKLSVLYGCCAA